MAFLKTSSAKATKISGKQWKESKECKFMCSFCKKVFVLMEELEKHLEKEHEEIKEVK